MTLPRDPMSDNRCVLEIAARPVFLYDGDCAFCSSCARFISRNLATSAQVLPWQTVELAPLGVTEQQCQTAVQWIDCDNRVHSGSRGIAELLVDAGSIWRPAGRMLRLRPVLWLANPLYRWISRNRHRMPGGTATCSLPHPQRR